MRLELDRNNPVTAGECNKDYVKTVNGRWLHREKEEVGYFSIDASTYAVKL